MADAANKYAENVPGKFYVDDQCIDCDLSAKPRPPISNETMTAAIPTSINSQRHRKKKDSVKKQWKAVRSKRSVTTGTARNPVAAVCGRRIQWPSKMVGA